jgi:hypothetical protein
MILRVVIGTGDGVGIVGFSGLGVDGGEDCSSDRPSVRLGFLGLYPLS